MAIKKTWNIRSLTHEINEHQRQEAKKRHKEKQQFRETYTDDDLLFLFNREWDDKRDFVEVSTGTVRKWFMALEKKKIISPEKEGNKILYDELCLKIGIYIFGMRHTTNISLDDIYESVLDEFNLAPPSMKKVLPKKKNSNSDLIDLIIDLQIEAEKEWEKAPTERKRNFIKYYINTHLPAHEK